MSPVSLSPDLTRNPARISVVLRYALAGAAAFPAYSLHARLASGEHFYGVYIMAIAIAAWFAGWGPSLECTAVSCALGLREVFPLETTADWLHYSMFVATSLLICWLTREIVTRKQTQKQLEYSRKRLGEMLRAGRAWSWEWNSATREISRSPEADYILPELKGIKSAEEAFARMHRDDGERIRAAMWQAFEERRTFNGEFRYVMGDGSVRWFSVQSDFVRGENGEPDRMAGVSIDITDRKQAESDIARLASIVQHSEDAILSETLDGAISSWNAGAEKMYGYSAQEILGKSIGVLIPADRESEMDELLKKIQQGEPTKHLETERITKDGRRLQVALTVSPVRDSRDRLIGSSTVARDISARKRAEEALRHAEKLSAVGRMAATIAHEINNPLESVVNVLYLLDQQTLSQPASAYVKIAKEEVTRIAHIVKQTLGFYREAAVPAQVRLTEVLEDVLALYKRKIGAHNIEIVRSYGSAGRVQGFPGELRQIFSNLIINAVEAMPEGGRVVLRVSEGRHWKTGVRGVRVSIADSGPGIEEQNRQRMFEPFFTTKGERGTGLGLWVTAGLVAKHGGSIRLRSSIAAPHRGTAFSVFLPANAAGRALAATGERAA